MSIFVVRFLQLASITTPMYRCPEQLDLWSNYTIGIKSDIWALGCVVYYLCFQRHPFEDSAKLRIINANFTLPSDSRYACFHEIIKGCLQIDPSKRFDASTILDRLAAVSETKGWPLKGAIPLKVSGKCSIFFLRIYFNRLNMFLISFSQGKPIQTPPNVTPNASPMHTAYNTQINQSNNGSNSIPNRPPPPRPVPAQSSSGMQTNCKPKMCANLMN